LRIGLFRLAHKVGISAATANLVLHFLILYYIEFSVEGRFRYLEEGKAMSKLLIRSCLNS